MDHIIRRQFLELTLDGQQPPFDLQNRLSDQYYQSLLPVLEKWFDQLAGEDEVLFIDRLVLDLGVFSRRDFDDRLLKQRLIEKLSAPDLTGAMGVEGLSAETDRESSSADAGSPAADGGRKSSRINIRRRSTRHNAFEQWIWYMEKGYLPWSILRVTQAWEYKVLETLATDYPAITRLRSLLTSQPATLTRIVLQHDDIFLMRLTEILTTVVQSPLPQTLQELRRLLIYAANPVTGDAASTAMLTIPTPEKAWQDALMLAASLGKEGGTDVLTHRLLIHYWPDYPRFVPALQDYLTTHPIARQLVEPPSSPSATPSTPSTPFTISPSVTASDLHPPITSPLPLHGPLFPESKARPDKGPQPSGDHSIQPRILPAAPAPATATIPVKAIPVPPDIPAYLRIEQLPEEGLFLLNAGVILTHPFLSHLFKLSGLLASGRFIADVARQKAIHLLHYLSTGRTLSEEFELAAAKILCGCPLDYPVEKQSIITREELKEADSLLEGLLSHWGVKNITVEGLRGNFLTRNGKLTPKNDKLHLVIEKHAVDILVRTYPFPWNMSIIKLPWLQHTIHLDW
ncbi:MAG: hypothetical protein JST42_13955 [Bacteroidetes bacterium]|nr:hypothetical protein [Bacteroidota bacterium]